MKKYLISENFKNLNKMKKLTLLFIFFTLHLINIQAQNNSKQMKPFMNIKEGLKAPDIKGDIVYNPTSINDISLENLTGKVVIIEFWATWCAPCIKMFPHINTLADTFKNQDVVFISISGDKGEQAISKIKSVLNKHPLKTIVVSDNTGITTQEIYGPVAFPSTVLIDKRGNVEAITNPNMLTENVIINMLNNKPSGLKGVFIKELSKGNN